MNILMKMNLTGIQRRIRCLKMIPKLFRPIKRKNRSSIQKEKTGTAKPVKRVAATIAFAAVLGTGLGLFALNISGNKEASAPASLDASLGSQTAKAGDTAAEKQSTAGENKRHKRKVHIKHMQCKQESFQMKRVQRR